MEWLVLNSTKEVPEITISGYIGSECKVNYGDFQNALNQLKLLGYTKAKLIINSGGGDMIEGLAMYDAAKESAIEFDVQVIGMAASMGSLLMFIGKELPTISANARVMFHKARAWANGEAVELRQRADLCDALEKSVQDILVAKTKKTRAEILAWFEPNKETWMNATQAVANGVAREIVTTGTPSIELPTPDESEGEEQVWNKVYNQINHKQILNMKYSIETKTQFGLPANATDAEVETAIAALHAKAKTADDLQTQIKSQNRNRAEALISNAITAKKLTEADRKEWTDNAEANYAFVENTLSKINAPALPANQVQVGAEKGTATEDRSKWTLSDYAKNDYAGLEKMKVENKADYIKLCNAAGVTVEF